MAGCGEVLETPEHCREDHWSIPTDEEIQPWIDALKKVMETNYSEQFAKAKIQHSNERSTERTLDAFMPLFNSKASDNPLFYRQ